MPEDAELKRLADRMIPSLDDSFFCERIGIVQYTIAVNAAFRSILLAHRAMGVRIERSHGDRLNRARMRIEISLSTNLMAIFLLAS